MNKIVLITGATSGIGKACAIKFAQNGYDVIITGRRNDRLQTLAKEIESNHKVKVLSLRFDIQKNEEVQNAIGFLDEKWDKIDVLINNAGLALGLDPVQEGSFGDWDTMIDTNLKGLLYVSRAVSELMIRNGSGQIINIGSIAGKEVYPKGNVYCATKHAVDGLTKAMQLDLFRHNIKVSQVAPGAVETEFSEVRFKGDTDRAGKIYEGYKPLTPEDVADAVYYVATAPAHVNISDLLIMPMAQANATTFHKSPDAG
ncbi:MAG: SDR family NAD(P)-dependent oxidoreductase [Bacteroidetes bacterium]|nr:SDR family NAD(P)-dependent oxidoreductase [Bacteroidota bacterium]